MRYEILYYTHDGDDIYEHLVHYQTQNLWIVKLGMTMVVEFGKFDIVMACSKVS
jgi:hypothetical protein